MNILVCSMYNEAFQMIGDLYSLNHRLYCNLHNLHYQLTRTDFPPYLHVSWTKIHLIIEALKTKKYDYLLWIDADAFFYNTSFYPTLLLEKAGLNEIDTYFFRHKKKVKVCNPDNPFLYLSSLNLNGPNMGVFFVRACQESLDFFNHLWSYRDRMRDYPSEEAIMHFLINENDPLIAKGVRFIDWRVLHGDWTDLNPSDYILHFSSCQINHRIDLFHIFNPFREIQLQMWLRSHPPQNEFYQTVLQGRRKLLEESKGK